MEGKQEENNKNLPPNKEIEERIEQAKKDPTLAALLSSKKKKRDRKFIWVTWLAKLMAGELSCFWSLWFKTNFTNYKKIPESPELTRWQIDHSKLLYELRKERLAAKEKIFVEGRNRFSIEVNPGVLLQGVPDLITISDNEVTIYDCKTGGQKASHQIQLMIYMHYILHQLNKYPGLNPKGRLRYSQGLELEVPDSLIDEKFIKDLKYFLAILGGEEEPMKAPSKFECQYCNISKIDCPERIN